MNHKGQGATGGTRPALRVDPNEGVKAIGPCAHHIAMAQALIRSGALKPSSLAMAQQMARDAHTRPLSAGQVKWLSEGLAHLGIVVAVPAPMTFGPLPMRPPARPMA